MSDVTDALDALAAGERELDDVAEEFRAREWPVTRTAAEDAEDLLTRDAGDPEPMVEGSFDEVAAAYSVGQITAEQYAALAEAVAGAEPRE